MRFERWMALGLLVLEACSGEGGDAKQDAGATNAPDGSTPVASCTTADLAKCDYPEKMLASTEREGFSVPEPSTGRTLPLRVRVPEGPGPFPLVIWSHGGGMNDGGHRLGNEWGAALAANGYAVVHIAHASIDAKSGAALCSVAQIPAAECNLASGDEDSPLIAMVKALDIIAVLDRLKNLSDESVARGGPAIDLEKVATAGWSGGARGPQVLMGAKLKTTPSAPLFARPDDRIVAAVAISPAGPGFGGFFENGGETSWASMRGPLLYTTGTNDVKENKPELTGPIRRAAYTLQPSEGNRRLLYSNLAVGTGGHGTYNLEDASSTDERLSRFSRALRSAVVAFLDAHVKGDAAAKDWLASANAKVLGGDVDWEER